jgi:hypothetical protein
MTVCRKVASQCAWALALVLASGATAAAAEASASSFAALGAYDYEADKARAVFEVARDRCAERAAPDSTDADACEREARALYRAKLGAARMRYDAQLRQAGASVAGSP